jgi:predicted aspartyl protease
MIGKIKVVALVDTGRSGTLVDSRFALKAGCKVRSAKTMRVIVAKGAKMQSKAACKDCEYIVQGYKFKNDFRLLQLKGYDVILGTLIGC